MRHGTAGRRQRNRGNSGGRRSNHSRTQVFDSNGPDVRIRGTAHQVAEKYLMLAKDAYSSGDRIMAENYFQHAEHYIRIINEFGDDFEHEESSDSESGQRTFHDGFSQRRGNEQRNPQSTRDASNFHQAGENVSRHGRGNEVPAKGNEKEDLSLPSSILGLGRTDMSSETREKAGASD